ncbi:hypothetical protein DAMA08_021030 (mitochondrion) [Martiniozyma asiatica (nom. inval.)]|nr:hypothetical protein DAMA08_021030 [Martiniozyma asiatica]
MMSFMGLSGMMGLTRNRLLSMKENKNTMGKLVLMLCMMGLYMTMNELNSINMNDYGYLRVENVLNMDFGYDGMGLIF